MARRGWRGVEGSVQAGGERSATHVAGHDWQSVKTVRIGGKGWKRRRLKDKGRPEDGNRRRELQQGRNWSWVEIDYLVVGRAACVGVTKVLGACPAAPATQHNQGPNVVEYSALPQRYQYHAVVATVLVKWSASASTSTVSPLVASPA